MKYYVYHVWGGVEPTLFGPYKNEEERDVKAAELVKEDPDDEIFWLDVSSELELSTGAYGSRYISEILSNLYGEEG